MLSPTENRIKAVETGNVNYLTLGFVESAARGAIWGSVAGGLIGGLVSLVEGKSYNPVYVMAGTVWGVCLDEAVNVTRTFCLALAKRAGPERYKEFLKKFYRRDSLI